MISFNNIRQNDNEIRKKNAAQTHTFQIFINLNFEYFRLIRYLFVHASEFLDVI